jgi:hypothetical protein
MEKELNFSKSCQTISLKKSDIFMSSFPGKIVFGEPNFIGYDKSNSFQYKHIQFLDLYLSLLKIVNFFATASNIDDKGQILTCSENTIYFWSGKIFEKSKVTQKVVKLGKEYDSNITYELILDAEQFNEFVYIFAKLMFSCLCLKSFERQFLEDFVNEIPITKLITLTDKRMINQVIQNKKQKQKIDDVIEQNLIELLLYYHELIILFKKIQSLNNPKINESNRIEAILNQ